MNYAKLKLYHCLIVFSPIFAGLNIKAIASRSKKTTVGFIGLLCLAIASGANAQLIEFSYQDTNGNTKIQKPDYKYSNPVGQIKFSLSGGIDRKVKISYIKDGVVINSSVSNLLGATDLITAGGNSYYGAVLNLNAPSEGKYTLRAEILSSTDSVVQEFDYSWVVDVSKPSITGSILRSESALPIDVLSSFNNYEGQGGYIYADGVSDDSGIVKSIFFATQDSGLGKRKEIDVGISNGRISVLLYDIITNNDGIMPLTGHYYQIGFEITDKAGNKSSVTRISARDVPVENIDMFVQNAITGNLEPYTTNMMVYENPVNFYIGMKKSNHTSFNGTNFGYKSSYSIQDTDYVYFKMAAPYPFSNTEYSRVVNYSGQYRDVHHHKYPITLSPDVDQAPELISVEYHINKDTNFKSGGAVPAGWYKPWEKGIYEQTISLLYQKAFWIDKLRITVKPKNFIQRVSVSANNYNYCDIPAGELFCELSNKSGEISVGSDYLQQMIKIGRYTPSTNKVDLLISPTRFTVGYDLNPPQISASMELTQSDYIIQSNIVDTDRLFGDWRLGTWDTRIGNAYATNNDTGNKTQLPALNSGLGFEIIDTQNRIARHSLKQLPDGIYTISAEAIDTYGNKGIYVFPGTTYIDNSAPVISITASSAISSLDDITISVIDGFDPSPIMESIKLEGGPINSSFQLSWRSIDSTTFKLEYPVMFPSLKEGENYTLTVTTSDSQKNKSSKTVTFDYKPRQVSLADGMDGKISIPAIAQEFMRPDGKRIIETNPLTLGDGSPVSGKYDVYATLRNDAQVPLVVNGVSVNPGETTKVMSQLDFGSTGGRISIPLKPAQTGLIGSSSVLITTSAPNSPIIVVDVNTWAASAELSSESWTVKQVIDTLKISAVPGAGSICRLSIKEADAKAADPIRDPVCYLEWDTKPDEAEPTSPVAGLLGQAVAIGVQPVSYSLYLYSGGTNKIKVGGGTQDLTVISAAGSVGYQVAENFLPVSRSIQLVNASLKQTVGNDCTLTISAERAKTDAANKALGAASRTCVLEWLELPEGISQAGTTDTPKLSGYMDTNGTFPIKWRVSIFSKNGTRITLNDQVLDVNVVDPEAPKIEMLTKYLFKDNIYVVPMAGGYFGDTLVTSVNADLNVDILRNNESILSEKYAAGSAATNKMYRRVSTDDRKLWEETSYKVSALFSKLTDVKTEASYRVIAAPAESVKPVVVAEGTSAIDTEVLPVTVNIRDQYKPNDAYSPDTMGVWKVRLISQKSFNEVEPLSEFVDAENGTATFNADLSNVSASYVRIAAEAVLQSPVEGYERTVVSTRPVFMTMLRGGAIDAGVTARRLSGAAPFTTVFKLGLTDRQDYRAAGSIIWETSTDGGNNWETYIPDERYKYQLVKTFEKGQYLVRAKVINKNSDAEAYTESVEVVAYNQPQLTVNGPTTLLIGQEYNFTATPTINKEPVSPSDVQIDWSLDGGVTYTQSGPSITLSGDKASRIRLWTRVRDLGAPTDDPYAYKIVKSAIEIKSVKAPRTYVAGPNVIETGKTYVFKANVQLPYRGMDAQLNGFFTLPDGSTVEGDSIEYTPTEEDLAKTSINTTYTAWIEGYRDQGAESTYSLQSRVWQYVWPKFNMQVRKTADVAPATITAVVRPVGFSGKLEEPTYEWVIPDGVAVEKRSLPTNTAFVVNEPGEYLLKVIVRDARGHEAVVEQLLTIGQAAEYEIDLQYSVSNPVMREPLDVLLRPYISGGHPRDRISTRTYSVDGTDLGSTGIYGRANLLAGDHKVKLTIQSEMGHEVEKEVTIPVVKNQLPSCSLTSRETVSSLMVYAVCKDPDGRMKSYEWTVDGERLSISSERITINKAAGESNPSVSLIGVDDSGGKSESVSL